MTRSSFHLLNAATIVALSLHATAVEAADTWTTPFPGVRHLLRTTSEPNRINAVQIDLCRAGVTVRATKSSERGRTPSSFGQLTGADVVTNGDFFASGSFTTSGLAIGDGEHWGDTGDGGSHGFIVFGEGRAEIPPLSAIIPPQPWMDDVVGGKPQVLSNGQVISDSGSFCTNRHPRTAAGISRDGQTLILAVIDGRSTTSRGMKCSEVGELMKGLGAHNALNLDGGGSSAMWMRGEGVVNQPSGGTQRVVANHLGIFATGSGPPESCNAAFREAVIQAGARDASTTDIDGDGDADACARGAAGIFCYTIGPDGAGPRVDGPKLTDDSGWADVSNYATLRFGDLNADGIADICARSDAGVTCWYGNGAGWPTSIDGPELADSVGWANARFYATIRLADFNGDDREDLCVRTASEFRCYPSQNDGFGPAVLGPSMTSEDGWDAPAQYGTIRMADIDGDGTEDLCARASEGIRCWTAGGGGFGSEIVGPEWSDAVGWGRVQYWSTIRLVDVNGDGMADICARGASGFQCHLSTGDGFDAATPGPALSDEQGWDDFGNYSTIRLADLDADGDADLCARADDRVYCWRWETDGFGTRIDGPEWADSVGWSAPAHFLTFRMADVDGDGDSDLCARAGAGIWCRRSDGTGFPDQWLGPTWTNDSGWSGAPYYSTIRIAGPRCIPRDETCDNGLDDDCDGDVDEGCSTSGDMGTGTTADGGSNEGLDGGSSGGDDVAGPADGGGGEGSGNDTITSSGGCCGTATGSSFPPPLSLALLIGAAVAVRRRFHQ